jgi:glucose/arabinose dehydrogenase
MQMPNILAKMHIIRLCRNSFNKPKSFLYLEKHDWLPLYSYLLISLFLILTIGGFAYAQEDMLETKYSLDTIKSDNVDNTIDEIKHSIYSNDKSDNKDHDIKGNEQALDDTKPDIKDPNLRVEPVAGGLELPTSMAFLGPDDILVLEKEKGTVQRIVNGEMLPEPILDVNVATQSERGMLGIAVDEKTNNPSAPTYVFLYYTEAESKDGEDLSEKKDPLGNRLYRYELVNDKLVNPKLLLDLPTKPGFSHNGGVVTIGPDNNVYVIVGDLNYLNNPSGNTLSENIDGSPLPDGRGGILRVTQNGEVVEGVGILGNETPLNKYYAYGIRNSFGIAFDPLTGKLWDTENGLMDNDEINLVEPGFNSGWRKVMGIASVDNKFDPTNNLVDFGGKGKYSDPEFEWREEVGPTAITFLNSDKLGKQYENDMFVGDFHNGNLYHFGLNQYRTGLTFNGILNDGSNNISASNYKEEKILSEVIFGKGFGGITDIEVGPDGYLYVVSIGLGGIYRIVPSTA